MDHIRRGIDNALIGKAAALPIMLNIPPPRSGLARDWMRRAGLALAKAGAKVMHDDQLGHLRRF